MNRTVQVSCVVAFFALACSAGAMEVSGKLLFNNKGRAAVMVYPQEGPLQRWILDWNGAAQYWRLGGQVVQLRATRFGGPQLLRRDQGPDGPDVLTWTVLGGELLHEGRRLGSWFPRVGAAFRMQGAVSVEGSPSVAIIRDGGERYLLAGLPADLEATVRQWGRAGMDLGGTVREGGVFEIADVGAPSLALNGPLRSTPRGLVIDAPVSGERRHVPLLVGPELRKRLAQLPPDTVIEAWGYPLVDGSGRPELERGMIGVLVLVAGQDLREWRRRSLEPPPPAPTRQRMIRGVRQALEGS